MDTSFASASDTTGAILGEDICPETVRKVVEGHGQKRARSQRQHTASEAAFGRAQGEVEFTKDAGKVNTREGGGKGLKIAAVAKRAAGKPCTPEQWKKQRLPAATIVLALAMIATAKDYRNQWRPWLRRLGVRCLASVQASADGASWIGKAVGRAFTGCLRTLDFSHACQHFDRCAERVYGGGTAEKRDAYRHARS